MKNRLYELRIAKGISQIAVQVATQIDQSLLSKYEKGIRVPTTDALMKLADFYNVSIDYILCRTDKPEINR